MFNFAIEKTKTNFQISVGEDGAVVIYTKDGVVQNRLFVRTTEKQDTQKLMQLLNADPYANISIYLDTLDQSFVQKTLPGVNSLSVNKIAQNRLEKEIPKNYVKTYEQVMRHTTGRRDWVYTFIAASYDAPLSNWIEFLLPYKNIIEGIYFFPVELAGVLPRLRDKHLHANHNSSFIGSVKSLLSPAPAEKPKMIGWEILICQNKTGGFRQVAFLNGKIIFSRLLNNISDPDEDVMAGNIEQEIANSTEYLTRLALGMEDHISVYLILSQEILKFIRTDKIKAENIKLFSLHQVAEKLGLFDIATARDKFFDPIFLHYMAATSNNINRVHIDITKQVYLHAIFVKVVKKSLNAILPVFALLIAFNLYTFLSTEFNISSLKSQIQTIETEISSGKSVIDSLSSRTKGNLPVKQLNEIVSLHKFMTQNPETPVDIALKLSPALPDYARVKKFNWQYYDSVLMNFIPSKSNPSFTDPDAKRPFKVELNMMVLFTDIGNTYQELEDRYSDFVDAVNKVFDGMEVSVSDLPKNISFESKNNQLSFNVLVSYPLSQTAINQQDTRGAKR